MSRKDEITHQIAIALDALHNLSDNMAREPNQFLAINEAELVMYKVRQTFEQELPKEQDHE